MARLRSTLREYFPTRRLLAFEDLDAPRRPRAAGQGSASDPDQAARLEQAAVQSCGLLVCTVAERSASCRGPAAAAAAHHLSCTRDYSQPSGAAGPTYADGGGRQRASVTASPARWRTSTLERLSGGGGATTSSPAPGAGPRSARRSQPGLRSPRPVAATGWLSAAVSAYDPHRYADAKSAPELRRYSSPITKARSVDQAGRLGHRYDDRNLQSSGRCSSSNGRSAHCADRARRPRPTTSSSVTARSDT